MLIFNAPGLLCVQDDTYHTQSAVMISCIKPERPTDFTVAFVPILIVETACFIAPFQEFDFEACLFKHLLQGSVIIHDFVRKCRMVRVSVSADLHHILVPFVLEVLVRDSNSYIATVLQIIKTVSCCDTPFLIGHMLPDVLRKESYRLFIFKKTRKIRSYSAIRLVHPGKYVLNYI